MVSLTDINSTLLKNLKQVGLLTDSGEISEAFKGSSLSKITERLLSQFGSTARSVSNISSLKGKELSDAIANIGRKTAFGPEKSLNYGRLVHMWKSERNAITRDIFSQYEPKVTRPLAIYFDQVGDRLAKIGGMKSANKRYSDFMQVFRPIEELTSDPIAARRFISSLDRNSVRMLGIDQLESVMPKALHFSDDILNFNAVQKLSKLDTPSVRSDVRGRVATYMDNVFSESPSSKPISDLVENVIDPGLPKSIRLTDRAKVHASAKALHKSIFSILRAKFLSGSVGIPSTVGAITGGVLGGFPGTMAGLTAGFALQDPRIVRTLIKNSNLKGVQILREALSNAPSQISPQVGSVLSGLLRGYQAQNG